MIELYIFFPSQILRRNNKKRGVNTNTGGWKDGNKEAEEANDIPYVSR